MLHPRAEAETFHATASRLITLRGLGYVSRLLADQRKADPSAFTRSELAVLSQLLRSPYVSIQVARIAPEDMPPKEAESVLQKMRAALEAGASWADAYRKQSDSHPDTRDPKSVGTLVHYLYDSTVSPRGFDFVTYRTAESLPLEHLRDLFRFKRGTHILRAQDGVYLYHIRSYYDDAG
jgi:hypothetical protein